MNRRLHDRLDRRALELWQQSPRGQRLLARECVELQRRLPDLFGRHLLQVGSWGARGELLGGCQMLHRAVLGTVAGAHGQARVRPDCLPLPDKSVDALLLSHVLDFAESPQAVLRESNRVLTERGRLIVLGFNPVSVWGLRQRLGLHDRAFPAAARFIRSGRLCDWLELLDFEVTEIVPLSLAQTQGLSLLAGAYLLFAKKRVIPLSLIGRPRRSIVRPLIGSAALPGAHRTSTPESTSE